MAKKKVNKLSDVSIDEVSLVDRGANPHAKVLLSKRDEGDLEEEEEEPIDKASPDASDLHVKGEDDDERDDDEEEETSYHDRKVKKDGFFTKLVSKMFGEELTTEDQDPDNIADMDPDDVSKAVPGQQIPFGQQQMGQPAPGPQNMMPGAQAFPAAPGQMPGQMQAAPPLPDEVVQYIQQLEQALAQAQGQGSNQNQDAEDNVNPFGKSAEMDDDEVTFLQELAKNLEDEDTREAVNKALEAVSKAEARAEEAETIAKAERDHRLTQEYIAKAKTYVNLPVDPSEFGPVLKRLHETMPDEDVELLTKALSSSNELVASTGIFSEIGKQGGAGGYEVISKVDAKAKEMVEKSTDMTLEQARAKVLEDSPDLYDEYLQENDR